ncbi:HAMP domain-containing histidine kinase [bacterium]|nr:HAMP domain-containing histidine kinase [bacterium]
MTDVSTTSEANPQSEKRRLLVLVRTGLTLAIGYLLIFSTRDSAPPPALTAFVVLYLASNIVVALMPSRILARAGFDVGLILTDTAAISFALSLIPDANTDVFVFYFTVILLASITDRTALSLLSPLITSGAYLAFLLARYGVQELMQPSILLRLPFFLLTGTFYGFFVDRVRRGQIAVAAAKQRAAARTELLQAITHDLKQPLWVASESATMLYDRLARDAHPARELAAQIMVSLRRMEALTLNFLDLGKLELRGLCALPQRTSLTRIVDDLLDAVAPACDLKGVRLDRETAPALPQAWIDPIQAERCLGNILDNAIKFTPAGGTVSVRTAVDGNALAVRVADDGPGISPEREAGLFDSFQAGTASGGRRSSGLGLHIADALARAMGGSIDLDHDHTRGTCFVVRLPIAAEQVNAMPLPAPAATAA